MLFKRIESEGLAHYSYLIGDKKEAAVIDPRRDCDVYLKEASYAGYRIKYILETHRNEDYVVGSVELAELTGAEIWHADAQWDYRYGQPSADGQVWSVGRLRLQAVHSPGHTSGMMSYLLYDSRVAPWMVFTGDALFAGDVGRVDLLGMGRAEEMAGLLYDSIFGRLLPLGDHIIVCPAHGPGSVCGTSIADRPWTTIGLERLHNPRLQLTDRATFVSRVARELERPPYFREMEKENLTGGRMTGGLPAPTPLSPESFAENAQNAVVLDTRAEVAFGAAHVPGILSIWLDGIPSFAGWFLPYNKPILLVNDGDDPMPAIRHLRRLGYDEISGYLSGGMLAWHAAGRESSSVRMITAQGLCRRMDATERAWILDVRSTEELEEERITGAHHIHVTRLPEHFHEIPQDRPVYLFCGTGLRSMIAASLLQQQGWQDLYVVLGGLTGWTSITCPVRRGSGFAVDTNSSE